MLQINILLRYVERVIYVTDQQRVIYVTDQHIIEICRELIMHLAVARNDIVQEKMLPTLVSIIQQQHPDTLPSTLQPVSRSTTLYI